MTGPNPMTDTVSLVEELTRLREIAEKATGHSAGLSTSASRAAFALYLRTFDPPAVLRLIDALTSKDGERKVFETVTNNALCELMERSDRAEFLLAVMAATFEGPHGWFETRRLWHSAVQDNYENAYVEQTVADEWRKRAGAAEEALALFHEHKGWTANYIAQAHFDRAQSAESLALRLSRALEKIAAGHQPPESIGDNWKPAYRGLQQIAREALSSLGDIGVGQDQGVSRDQSPTTCAAPVASDVAGQPQPERKDAR